MRIIAYTTKNSGPGYHRIVMPLLTMPDVDVYITNNLLEEHFEKGCDVFMYSRVLPESAQPIIARLKTKYGFKVVVDIDDHWHLDTHHILYELYQHEGFAAQQIRHIIDADAVLTTHERLADEVRIYNRNVHILPNAIPHQGQYDIEREPYYLTRLFWQGSVTHRADLQLLAKPIVELRTISPKIKFILAGHQDHEPDWHEMAAVYTGNFRHQYKIIQGLPVTNYYSAYANADICLVPLVASSFNSMKSNLKVLEAANLGLPCVVSDVHPYKDMPVLYARWPNDWVKHIKRLVGSRKAQKQEGARLQEWVQEHYNFHKINQHRKQVLEYISSKQNATI